MINAGKYNRKILIYTVEDTTDSNDFKTTVTNDVLTTYANVHTTKGITIIKNNSDFEKALTNFTIRYSSTVENAYYNNDDSNRNMYISFRNKVYHVEYLNNVNEENVELEIQAKEILH